VFPLTSLKDSSIQAPGEIFSREEGIILRVNLRELFTNFLADAGSLQVGIVQG